MTEVETKATPATGGLTRYLSPINAWALSFGCAIGWGAFVMPATTLLPTAGPLGTVVALLLGALIMVVVAANFHFLLNRYPDSGGAFTFTQKVFGYDHAFLCSWALILAYVSIMWANATAFVLIIRFLFGPVFQVGFHYQVAGYDVYFGEVVFTLAILAAFGLLSCARKRFVNAVNTSLAVILLVGSVASFFIVLGANPAGTANFTPAFSPDGNVGMQVFGILALAPWAYLGFESVSHATGEIRFSPKMIFGVMTAGVASAVLVYILMTAVSLMGMPSSYASWPDYIADLGNLDGLEGLPTFHAMKASMGTAGIALLGITVVGALSTSLIGLYRASSRLIYSAALESIFPERFAKLNSDGVPRNAILFIMAISIVVPFVGRAAIGWIVDVTSVSAAIVYGYASASCLKIGLEEKRTMVKVTGTIGVLAAIVFLVYPLVPTVWSVSALAPESYLILAAWGISGLLLFRIVFHRDRQNKFGKATIAWIFMLFMVLFSSTMWMRQVMNDSTDVLVEDLTVYYADDYAQRGIEVTDESLQKEEAFVEGRTDDVRSMLMNNSLVQMGLIIISIVLMFDIYSLMRRRQRELDEQRLEAQQSSKAKTTFLSNMSHDIRTPMNAIIGYTNLAQRQGTTLEETQAYLGKIDASSKHLLALINDVLEMSRIESGKMELDPAQADLRKMMTEVRDMFATQMSEKDITFTVQADDLQEPIVMCDENRLNRVLLNLLSNAYKFTPKGGSVSVTLRQLAESGDEGMGRYELRVKDSGIGMTAEFAAKVFEAFERERSATVNGIQGTGLGMAITKSIVDLMGGDIRVITAPGEGTEFVIDVGFPVVDVDPEALAAADAEDGQEIDFTGKRMLIVEDNEINREIAELVLEEAGFETETAEDGKIGYEMVANSEPGYYDVVLMDVQMPVMNGYEATAAIRKLDDPALASIPIVAASANAFSEDVQEALAAGMDAHVAKPLDVPKVLATLAEILK